MLGLEAPRLNISMSFLDPGGHSSPAGLVAGVDSAVIAGGLNEEVRLRELAAGCDVVTCEIEHIGTEVLERMEREDGVNVQPSGRVVRIIQDKLVQKEHFQKHNIPVAPFLNTPSIQSIKDAATKLGLPLMLKSRRGGYDGRGNAVLKDSSQQSITDALTSLGAATSNDSKLDLYAEGWCDFQSELAVMVVRSTTGETRSYPAVNAVQTDSVCRVVLAPARNTSQDVRRRCEEMATEAVGSLGDGAAGVFGVELFLVGRKDAGGGVDVLLNEVAPRPHNTGHYTQDACAVSQFENHLRAVCGLPLGDTRMSVGAAAMVNVLGAPSGTIEDTMKSTNLALTLPRTTVHWYGKNGCRAGRKMGHINLTADSHAELDLNLTLLLASESIPHSALPPSCQPNNSPLVGVIMGSQSDLPAMQAAVEILQKFNIPYEVDIVSAHRTPDKMVTYARTAATRGLEVIIAGAGGAAHLPGMVAAMTPLPVVGVPIKTSTLNGQDSLLSIVQMPRGVPVATVAIGNAMNAGLLAVRMLGGSRAELRGRMEGYQKEMEEMVEGMSRKLTELGSEKFLEGMENKNQSVNV